MSRTPPIALSSRLTTKDHSEPVVVALRDLARTVNEQHAQLGTLGDTISNLRIPSIAQIRAALQASGGSPLNITQLIPATPTPGSGGAISVGTHVDRLALVTASLALGDLYIESDRVAIYEWTALGWVFLGNLYSPMDVTLAGPDTKPTDLAGGDTGFYVFATDYCRYYKWTGAAWAEDNHNPSRFQFGLFNAAPDQNGWFVCDGTTVSRSTTTGGVTNYTTPDLITAGRFLRANAAAGGVGDTSTHHHSVDPPATSTGTASATATVHDGGGAPIGVVADTATYLVNIAAFNSADTQALPPWYEAIPYIRLAVAGILVAYDLASSLWLHEILRSI